MPRIIEFVLIERRLRLRQLQFLLQVVLFRCRGFRNELRETHNIRLFGVHARLPADDARLQRFRIGAQNGGMVRRIAQGVFECHVHFMIREA
ncbi:MAG: hypothetical protein ACRD4H_01785 [Candidatus Acidiferrales bacterium]